MTLLTLQQLAQSKGKEVSTATCEVCKKIYETHTEFDEIKQSGSRICTDCWEKED